MRGSEIERNRVEIIRISPVLLLDDESQ